MTAPFYYPQEQPTQSQPLSPEEQAQQEQMALVQQSAQQQGSSQQQAGDMDETLDAPGLKFREKLKGSVAAWPEQVLNSFYQDYPALAQANPQVQILRSEETRGYAVGVLQFPEAPGVSIPFVVEDFSLKPFSVILKGEDAIPLTEERLDREFLSTPAQGIVDPSDREYQSAMEEGEFEPPAYYSGPGAMSDSGNSVFGKLSHLLVEDFDALVKSAQEVGLDIPHADKFKLTVAAPSWRSVLLEFADSHSSIRTTVIGPDFEKVSAVRPAHEVMSRMPHADQIVLNTQGYLVKSAFDDPSALPPGEGLDESQREEGEETSEDGVYAVKGVDGQPLVGMVFHRVYDFDGSVAPLKVFIDMWWETAATQPSIIGQRLAPIDPAAFVGHTPSQPDRENVLIFNPPGEPPAVTIPFHVESVVQGEGGPVWQVETFLGERYTVSHVPGLQVPVMLEPGHVAVGDFQLIELPDPAKRSVLIGADSQFSYEAFEEMANPLQLKVSCDQGLYTITPRLGEDRHLGRTEAEAMLKAAGVQNARKVLKKAAATTVSLRGSIPSVKSQRWSPQPPPEGRPSTEKVAGWARALTDLQSDETLPGFLQDLLKTAGNDTVDSVLSLGFLRPENTRDFVNNTGLLEQASKVLAQLVLARDLGYTQIPEHEVRSAMLALEEVIRSLRQVGQTMTDGD